MLYILAWFFSCSFIWLVVAILILDLLDIRNTILGLSTLPRHVIWRDLVGRCAGPWPVLRQPTQRQNECACSAFSRASGHFLVSGYDQKAVITEKVPVLCSS